jgi:single-strand DNA-binding protein
VIVTGRLKQRSYDTREGEKRTVVELEADEVAPSLKFATASVRKATRTSDGGSGGGFSSGSAPADDPWGSAPPSPQGYGSGFNETPPF